MSQYDPKDGNTVQPPNVYEELAVEAGADAVRVVEYADELTIVVYVSGLSENEQDELIDSYADPWSGTLSGIQTIVDFVEDVPGDS